MADDNLDPNPDLAKRNELESTLAALKESVATFAQVVEKVAQVSERAAQTLNSLSPLKSASDYAARLADQAGDSEEDLIFKALALYDTALEAKDHDHRIVIVTKDYKFVQEIIGIGRSVPEPQTEAAVG